MNIGFQIDYRTVWGESVLVTATWISKTGKKSQEEVSLSTTDGEVWRGETFVPTDAAQVEYSYSIVQDEKTVRCEWTGVSRSMTLPKGFHRLQCTDRWRDEPSDNYLYSSAFTETFLDEGWRFHLGDVENAWESDFPDADWQRVTVPHDWAITGPFDRKWDLQKVAVKQNGENVATWKTGRSGGLPYIGVGWYRYQIKNDIVDKLTTKTYIIFDGAMSEAHVYVNVRHYQSRIRLD